MSEIKDDIQWTPSFSRTMEFLSKFENKWEKCMVTVWIKSTDKFSEVDDFFRDLLWRRQYHGCTLSEDRVMSLIMVRDLLQSQPTLTPNAPCGMFIFCGLLKDGSKIAITFRDKWFTHSSARKIDPYYIKWWMHMDDGFHFPCLAGFRLSSPRGLDHSSPLDNALALSQSE